ncbi:MAG: LuxR C-terminal-related transcriptional regulator [Caldilineaceae bacterium]
MLDEAEALFVYVHIQEFRPVAALKARVRLAQGQIAEALRLLNARGLSVDDELSYLREFEHMTLARVLIARYKHEQREDSLHDAMRLLVRLLAAAEAGGRVGSVIDILLLQALVDEARGDMAAALVPLERALTLAQPEGYMRTFVDEGPAMARLLDAAVRHERMPAYARKLLTAFEGAEQVGAGESMHAQPSPSATVSAQPQIEPQIEPLIEPLTQRELEVLQLVAQGLSNREIGERLFLALSTVKGHNRIIFDKLQVQRRTEAVARARELGLV